MGSSKFCFLHIAGIKLSVKYMLRYLKVYRMAKSKEISSHNV